MGTFLSNTIGFPRRWITKYPLSALVAFALVGGLLWNSHIREVNAFEASRVTAAVAHHNGGMKAADAEPEFGQYVSISLCEQRTQAKAQYLWTATCIAPPTAEELAAHPGAKCSTAPSGAAKLKRAQRDLRAVQALATAAARELAALQNELPRCDEAFKKCYADVLRIMPDLTEREQAATRATCREILLNANACWHHSEGQPEAAE